MLDGANTVNGLLCNVAFNIRYQLISIVNEYPLKEVSFVGKVLQREIIGIMNSMIKCHGILYTKVNSICDILYIGLLKRCLEIVCVILVLLPKDDYNFINLISPHFLQIRYMRCNCRVQFTMFNIWYP